MIMHDILLILFQAANALAVLQLIGAYILNIVARARKSKLERANIIFPVLSELHPLVKHCYWCGMLFMVLNWLLCTTSVLDAGGNEFSMGLLTFGVVWAVMIFVGLICEIIARCFKYKGSEDYSMLPGVKSSIWYTVWYLVLSFLFA